MKSPDQPFFIRVLEDIRCAVDLSEREFSELLGTTFSSYTRILEGRRALTPDLIARTSQHLHISTDAIFSGKIDYLALSAQFHGNPLILPERYGDEKRHFARTRSVLTVINYLKSLHGSSFTHQTLRRLQLRMEMFANTEGFIHPFVLTDLLDELEKSGFHPEQFREMGKVSTRVNQKTAVNSVLSQARNPQELYEIVHEKILNRHYDLLFSYRLEKLNRQGLRLIVSPRSDSHAELRLRAAGGRNTCLYKQGVYASFIGHINRRFPRVLETSCIYYGDPHCSMQVSWDP